MLTLSVLIIPLLGIFTIMTNLFGNSEKTVKSIGLDTGLVVDIGRCSTKVVSVAFGVTLDRTLCESYGLGTETIGINNSQVRLKFHFN